MTTLSGSHGVARFAATASAVTAAAAALAFGIGILTPPSAGVFCTTGCLDYPYIPPLPYSGSDLLWMIPAIVMVLSFVLVTAGLVVLAPDANRLGAVVGLTFAAIASALLVADYVVELTAVYPGIVRGEGAGLAALSLGNPHGVLIAVENAGYLLLGLALVGVGCAIEPAGRVGRGARWLFLLAGIMAVAALPVLILVVGTDLDVRYEVAAITIDYLTLLVGGALLARWFWRLAPAA